MPKQMLDLRNIKNLRFKQYLDIFSLESSSPFSLLNSCFVCSIPWPNIGIIYGEEIGFDYIEC